MHILIKTSCEEFHTVKTKTFLNSTSHFDFWCVNWIVTLNLFSFMVPHCFHCCHFTMTRMYYHCVLLINWLCSEAFNLKVVIINSVLSAVLFLCPLYCTLALRDIHHIINVWQVIVLLTITIPRSINFIIWPLYFQAWVYDHWLEALTWFLKTFTFNFSACNKVQGQQATVEDCFCSLVESGGFVPENTTGFCTWNVSSWLWEISDSGWVLAHFMSLYFNGIAAFVMHFKNSWEELFIHWHLFCHKASTD